MAPCWKGWCLKHANSMEWLLHVRLQHHHHHHLILSLIARYILCRYTFTEKQLWTKYIPMRQRRQASYMHKDTHSTFPYPPSLVYKVWIWAWIYLHNLWTVRQIDRQTHMLSPSFIFTPPQLSLPLCPHLSFSQSFTLSLSLPFSFSLPLSVLSPVSFFVSLFHCLLCTLFGKVDLK